MDTPMKVRWREHERLFVTLFVAIKIAGFIWAMSTLTAEWQAYYEAQYLRNRIAFDYTTNILLPQVGSILLLYLCYIWMYQFVAPLIWQLFLKERAIVSIRKVGSIVLHLLAVSYVFAFGINIATYYAHPHLINYGPNFKILSWLGYNDLPLTTLSAGFGRALGIVALYAVWATLRESSMYLVEKSGPKRDYRTLITNQFTSILVVYLAVLVMLTTFELVNDATLLAYVSFVPSVLLVFMTNIYLLFPAEENKLIRTGKLEFIRIHLQVSLLLSTLLCTFPFVLLYVKFAYTENFFLILLGCWALQLIVVTPLSRVLYQQRKDKILQVRGAQRELVKSKANLQFLRSQINPHFLFNSLNTLYGTALLENSERTAEGIQKLGDMMRFMLHENNLEYIPMSREIEYLTNYISLQKLRTHSSPQILIEENIREKNSTYLIAPMLLIPFVENAFKHGISTQEKSWITINLDANERAVHFEVRNSIHPHQSKDLGQEKSGIGLANVTERLALLYPGNHTLHVGRDANEFVVTLTLQPCSHENQVSGVKKMVNHF